MQPITRRERVFGTGRRWRTLGAAGVVTLLAAGPILADLSDKGVGPVTEVKVGPVDAALAQKGKDAFQQKCSACHKFEERYVGPALAGVTTRRAPEWIMNMILNPEKMTKENGTAQELLGEYMTQMTFQNVSQDDARAILEYFRQTDAASAKK
jgi:mono/diheme cytochrome c family protein